METTVLAVVVGPRATRCRHRRRPWRRSSCATGSARRPVRCGAALEQLVLRVLAAAPTTLRHRRAVGVSCAGPIDEPPAPCRRRRCRSGRASRCVQHVEDLTGLPVVLDTLAGAAAEGERLARRHRDHVELLPARARPHHRIGMHSSTASACGAPTATRARSPTSPSSRTGRLCVCGARGCLAAYASASALEAEMNRPLRRATPSIIERTGIMVGRAIASTAAAFDVATFVVSGVVVDTFGDRLLDTMRREVAARLRLPHLAGLQVIEPPAFVQPLVGAAALVGAGWLGRGTDELASRSCSRPTPPTPRPTARRCRRSSPRSSRRTGAASAHSRATRSTNFVTEWRNTLYEAGYLAPGWPVEYGGAGLTATRAGHPRRGVRQGRRADRRTERRVRHPDARQHAADDGAPRSRSRTTCRASCRARTRGARGTPSPTPAPTSATSASGRNSTATSGSSTVRRSGRRPATSPTTSSRSPAPIRTHPSTRASRSCSSPWTSPASRCVRSR